MEGTEIDPIAVENALHNLQLNQCTNVVVKAGELDAESSATPWVLVNILAKIIIDISEDINRVAQEHLLVSGFIHSQRSDILAAFPNFDIIDELTLGQWGCLYLRRPSP